MIEITDIYDEMEERNINYYDRCPLKKSDAVTLEVKGKYAIFADEKRFETQSELKSALMHEVGHCATGSTHEVCSPYDMISKHEAQANHWAFERFLPFESLNKAVTSGGMREFWELSEYFDLSEDYIREAIEYYTESLGYQFYSDEDESPPESYLEILKSIVFHISFSRPDMTIDDLSEEDAQKILEAIRYHPED